MMYILRNLSLLKRHLRFSVERYVVDEASLETTLLQAGDMEWEEHAVLVNC
jgi:hypothetical protein